MSANHWLNHNILFGHYCDQPGVQLPPERGLCGAKAGPIGVIAAVSLYGLLLRMRNTPNREVNMHSAAMAMTMAPKSA